MSRKIFRGRMKGERRSRRKGQSVEFADFRNYVPGDDLRFIDWNTYARLDRLFLKMFLEEEDLHFYALIDASASMDFGDPTKLQLRQATGRRAGVHRPGPRRSGEDRDARPAVAPRPCFAAGGACGGCSSTSTSFQPDETVPLAEGVKNFCLRNSGKGIVVLISDLMDKSGYEPALRYLLAQQMDVYVIHVLSAEEIDPDLQGDLRLVDCEDADVAEITVSGAAAEALQARRSRRSSSRPGSSAAAAAWSTCWPSNEMPVEELITDYLRAAGAGALMGLSLLNMLSWWQWAILAAVPPAIVALYFLKLKRRPLEVPSTYLWRRSIEDLHVNTIWQRLRRNLLLFLQLLLVLLVDPGPAAAGLARRGAHRRPVRLPGRQLGQHAGHRRRAQPPGRGQTPRRRTDRPDGRRATWPWSSASPTPPGSNRCSPTIATPCAGRSTRSSPRHAARR